MTRWRETKAGRDPFDYGPKIVSETDQPTTRQTCERLESGGRHLDQTRHEEDQLGDRTVHQGSEGGPRAQAGEADGVVGHTPKTGTKWLNWCSRSIIHLDPETQIAALADTGDRKH